MGIPDEPFWAPDELVAAYRAMSANGPQPHGSAGWLAQPSRQPEWQAARNATGLDGWDADLPSYELGESVATRKAIQKALDATVRRPARADDRLGRPHGQQRRGARRVPPVLRRRPRRPLPPLRHPRARDGRDRRRHGAARRHPAGQRRRSSCSPTTCDHRSASQRCRAPRSCFVFTHDSVGVGEDGPTHQPVEQLASLRAIPGLHVVRPADGNETIQAWADIVRHDGPSALILSRQNITVTTDGSAVERGAGIVRDSDGDPQVVLRRHRQRGRGVRRRRRAARRARASPARVVSMPSWDRFEAQNEEFRSLDPARRRAGAVGRGRRHVRLGGPRRRVDRHRPFRCQRTGKSRPGEARHQRRPRRRAAASSPPTRTIAP